MGKELPPKHFPTDPVAPTMKGPGKWEDHDPNNVYDWKDAKILLEECGVILPEHAKVLEIGSGKGLVLEEMKKDGFDAVGVDARPRSDKDVKQVAARIEQLPFADNSFDMVYSYNVFDMSVYAQDQNLMLAEVERVLKGGGIFIELFTETIVGVLPASFTKISKDPSHTIVYQKR